jgi:hypothetical protein
MTKILNARLGRVGARLAHAGMLDLPTGPVSTWLETELERLGHLIEVSETTRRAVWSRLTDADLEWLVAIWGGDGEAGEAATMCRADPGGRPIASP